jgi:Tol biopolymer transport system component
MNKSVIWLRRTFKKVTAHKRHDRAMWIGAVVLALFFSLAPSADAQVTSVNGKIAYTSCGPSTHPFFSTQCDIWVMEPDGTGQTNLTNTSDLNETNPAWSPDGAKIAFVEGYNGVNRLMVINGDGTGSVVITPDPSYQFSPTWSPGGTQIALVREVPGQVMSIQFDIIVINVDGSGEINITNSDFDELDPAWSPDGNKIAFAGVRFEQTIDPMTGEPTTAAQWELVTVNPEGSGEQILSAGDPGTPRAQSLEEDRAPAWSPDSTKLVFMSQSVDPCCDMWKILAVNRDGTGITLLSDNPDVNDLWPSWSPDGTLIIFTSDRDATFGGEFDIYTMPAPTSLPLPPPLAGATSAPSSTLQAAAAAGVTRLTTSGNASDPDWGRKPGTEGIIDIQGSVAVGSAPVVGTKVKLRNLVTKVLTKTTTDAAGSYQFDPVVSGSYKINIGLFEVGETTTVTGTLPVTGAPSAGTKVKLKNLDTAAVVKATTDASGNYSFPDVGPGNLKITVLSVTVP